MKYAEFSIFDNGRVLISMPSEEELERLIESLKQKYGVEIEEELIRGLCG